MGAVGPSQFIVAINGRIRSFDKNTGTADAVLDVSPDVFFAPGMTPVGGAITSNRTSDPRIRYDRGTRRWYLVIIDIPNGGSATNRIILAVSNTEVISDATTWTYFFIPASFAGDFVDYPTLGIDNNALYIGANVFTTAGGFRNTDAWVVRKSSITGGGPIVYTAFPNLINDVNCGGTATGPWTPQGVDNADTATEGYFIGVDNCVYGKLVVNRVTNPGGTPTLSAPIGINVAQTSFPADVPHLGNDGGNGSALGRLDGLDDRLYSAQIRGGRLWTAHSFLMETDGTSLGGAPTSLARNGVRWYELQNLATTPTVAQFGNVFDATSENPLTGNVRWYWVPSLNVSGQGHVAVGFTEAGPQTRANAAFTGRLAGAPAGTMDPVARITNTIHAYNPANDGGTDRGRRWGDYSYTSVDPADQMTMWTIQEYTEAPNAWGVRAVKLLAPPPATPSAVSLASIAAGQTSVALTITGTSINGSAYFDPTGSVTLNRLAVEILPGVTVRNVTAVTPTQISLVVSTVGAAPGPKLIRITNPDGQVVQDNATLLTVTGTAAPTITSPNSLICAVGAPCNFTFTTAGGAAASAFAVTGALPSGVVFASPALSGTPATGTQGTYTLTVTASNGTLPDAVQTFKLVVTASCGGFTDVTGTDIFCNSTDWLRNRGVTVGCTSATLYCPTDVVTRASMALFMQRLGDAIAPTTFSDNVLATGPLTLDNRPTFCTTADFAPANFPRVALVAWSFAGLAGAPLTARAYSQTSFDGGGSFATNEANLMRVTAQGQGWVNGAATVKIGVPAGASPRFRLRTDREAGTATSGNFVDGRCNVAVSLTSVNGGANPYDPPAGPREEP
jgi:hypothetical protein